jgi:hypothetical protein
MVVTKRRFISVCPGLLIGVEVHGPQLPQRQGPSAARPIACSRRLENFGSARGLSLSVPQVARRAVPTASVPNELKPRWLCARVSR